MRTLVVCCALFAAILATRVASAEVCPRPTDAAGYAGYSYAPAVPVSFDAGGVRVWYVTTGIHAVLAASTRTDGVPDDVANVGAVTADARQRYEAMGFRPPVSDTSTSCGGGDGDGRIDVYLVHFTGADGMTGTEGCTKTSGVRTCASFILAQANFRTLYATADEGIRTVLPHELFHAVQNAYDTELDRFWAEGTAQWATKQLDLSLPDLERFIPSFLNETARSLDAPPSGVTSGFLYGAAIWPVFLTEHRGPGIVKAILEKEGAARASALDAASAVFVEQGTTLAEEFTLFAVYNVATKSRAGTGGYKDAAKYSLAKLIELPDAPMVASLTSGLSSRYYHVAAGAPRLFTLDADATRTRAMLLPFEDGHARVDKVLPLPARLDGEGVVVVTGITTKKSDAPFTLTIAPAADDPTLPSGAVGDAGAAADAAPPTTATTTTTSGCSTTTVKGAPGASLLVVFGLSALIARRRRAIVSTCAALTGVSLPSRGSSFSEAPAEDGGASADGAAAIGDASLGASDNDAAREGSARKGDEHHAVATPSMRASGPRDHLRRHRRP